MLGSIDWSTESKSELMDWNASRHYVGDWSAAGARGDDLHFRTRIVTDGVCTIGRSIGIGTYKVRRSGRHIRSDPVRTYTIFYPIRRAMSFTQNGESSRAFGGELFVIDGDLPLYLAQAGERSNPWEVLYVRAPAHLLVNLFPNIDKFCARKTIRNGGLVRITQDAFQSIMANFDGVDEAALSKLIHNGLAMCMEAVKGGVDRSNDPVDSVRTSFQRVIGYIDQHLGDADLNVEKVARRCGMSPRYLHLVMAKNEARFSDCLWSRRLDQAAERIGSSEFSSLCIDKIAASAGFKSSSHFSRLYKTRYGCCPSTARRKASLARG